MSNILNGSPVVYAVMSVSSRGDFEGYPDLAVLELNENQHALIKSRLNLYRKHKVENYSLLCEVDCDKEWEDVYALSTLREIV